MLRAWIRGGAPRVGVVSGAPDVFDCGDSLDPSPNKIPPLPAPAADKGIQVFSGGWTLPAESEDEVCYVTYYDCSDRVPDWAKLPCPEAYGGPSRECFGYSSMLLAQDPQSHHSIVEAYIPPPDSPEQWDPKNEVWEDWQCLDGANDGMPCDPSVDGVCGEGSTCATAPERAPDYRSFFYQDPLYQRFDAENNLELLDSPNEEDRTFCYCATWDNGETNAEEVRKHSERPDANTCAFGAANSFVGECGCDPAERACLGGPNQGMACNGDDSLCGAGGVCDACPVWGGATTEEEMFGILGAYYVTQ